MDSHLEKCDTPEAALSSKRLTSTSFAPSSTPATPSTSDLEHPRLLLRSEAVPAEDFPDGGVRAWLTVFGAFMSLLCTFGQLNAFGTFQSWYAVHQLNHLSPATISWIGSLQLWVFFFSGSFVGRAFDAYGPSRVMVAGTVIYVLSLMLMSISTQYYQYIMSQGILFGLGVGMMFYPSLASISTHFSKYRATACGIAIAGSSLGGVMFPIMLQRLFVLVGFGWSVRISGFVCLVGCLVSVATTTSRLPPRKKSAPWADTSTFKDARFSLLTAGSFLVSLGLFIPYFYIEEYARDQNVPMHLQPYVLAVLNAGGVLGRIAPAYLSDTLGRFNTLAPSALLSGIFSLTLWLTARTTVQIMLYAALYGVASGAFISVVTPCVAQISDIREIGTRIGMLYTLISFPSLIGGPSAGALLRDEHGSYTGMIVLSGSTVAAGALLIFAARLKIDSRLLARV